MKRIALWTAGTIFVLLAMGIVWSLAYAATTALSFKTWALLAGLTKNDPLLSFKHVAYYWATYTVKKNAAIAAGITAAAFLGGWIALFVIKPPSLYGGARFARGGDLFRASMHAKNGLILGWHGTTLLRNDDARHPLVIGPTRSGKGRGFVIPNLLAWDGSTITVDIKQENFRETAAARRAAGDEVFMFAPGSPRSHCYNPLEFVRDGPSRITDLTNVAHFLIPDPKHGESIWSQKARDLFVGVLGYVLESNQISDADRTVRTALRVLSTGRDVGALLTAIVKAEASELSSFVVGRFNQIIAEPGDTRGSVLANLTTALAPWDNPLIAAVTTRSDFDIRELRRKRMSIYIGPAPSDLTSYRSLIRLLVQQIYDSMTREMPAKGDHHVLVMLDEFRQLQRMDAIVEQIPLSAGYGFRMAAILQNISQLDEIYGRAARESIVANCALKLFVGVDDLATANYVSDQLGQKTVTATTTNLRGGGWFRDSSTSKSLTGVPLLRPDEVIRLPRKSSILMIANEFPILTTKIRYDKDRWFRALIRSGTSTFRSVPELTLLREPSLQVLSPEYGKPGKDSGAAEDEPTAERPKIPAPGAPSPTATASPGAGEPAVAPPEPPTAAMAVPTRTASSRSRPAFGDELDRSPTSFSAGRRPLADQSEAVSLGAPTLDPRETLAGAGSDEAGPAAQGDNFAKSEQTRTFRPRGRQQETLFDIMADAQRDMLLNVGGLETIAELVEQQAGSAQGDEAASVAVELRELAQSSRATAREGLEELYELRPAPVIGGNAITPETRENVVAQTATVPLKKPRAPRKAATSKKAAPAKMPEPDPVKKPARAHRGRVA